MLAAFQLPTAVCILLQVYIIIVLVRVLLTWFRIPPSGPGRVAADLIAGAVDPLMRPLGRVVPPVMIGRAALDMGPLILLVVLVVLSQALC